MFVSILCLGTIGIYYGHISTTGQVSLAPAVILIIYYMTDTAAIPSDARLLDRLSYASSITSIFPMCLPVFMKLHQVG